MTSRELSAVIASEAKQSIAPRVLKHGLLRRFAPLRKRFAFVAGNDADRAQDDGYALSTPHHSAMNSAVALVDFRSDSRSTYSLKPCIAAPFAPKQRLGML